jgi:hypothetical protein
MVEAAHCAVSSDPRHEQDMAGIDIGIVLDGARVDVARAREMIDAYRAKYGASEWLDSVDAYCAAIWEAEGEQARATLQAGARGKETFLMTLAAEAAVAARTGDGATAHTRLGAMRAGVKAVSPFHNATYRDIGRQIEGLLT